MTNMTTIETLFYFVYMFMMVCCFYLTSYKRSQLLCLVSILDFHHSCFFDVFQCVFDEAWMSEELFHPHPSESYIPSQLFSLSVIFPTAQKIVLDVPNASVPAFTIRVIRMAKPMVVLS